MQKHDFMFIKKLKKFDPLKLKNKDWYHQRFDASPLFTSFIAFAEVRREKRKPAGTEADMRICFFKDGNADWYLDMKDVRRGSNVLIKFAQKNKNLSARIIKDWKMDEELFNNFFHAFNKINLRALDDLELLNLFEKYVNIALNRFTSSAIIDHFALGTDEIVERMLRQEVGKLDKESDFTNIFSVATAPVHQSFINRAEIELLKIAIATPLNWGKIGAYQRKYYWLKNNYIKARNLSVRHFANEIDNWKKSKKDLRVYLRQMRITPRLNKARKLKLFKKYNFSPLLKTLLKISEDFTWWQDERKQATYLNIDIGTKILNELAVRRGYNKESLKFLIIPEVAVWFKQRFLSQKDLNERMKKSVMIVTRQGYEVITGTKVNKIKKIMMGNNKKDKIRDVRGLSASVGRAIGRVRVVGSAREIGKVNQGDILVAVMTRPDYISGMRKAAAIVTNEGGITCHAAIISRELGIPCIIGTKIATQIFHDGDLVEVNANHGWVRKINI